MKPLPFLSCSLLLLAALPAQRERELPKLKNFTAENGTVKSAKVREGEAGFTIFLPKGYADEANKDVKYPWALWLSGFGGTNEFIDGGGIHVLDRLRGEDKVPPMAFVIYRGPSRRTVYVNGEAACDTEDLIVGDFLTEVQTKYRVAADRKHRALMGISAGGFGAMKIALRHPDVFGVVATHSAAILPVDPEELGGMNEMTVQRMMTRGGLSKVFGDPIDKAKWREQMPLAIVAAKKPEDLKGLQIYFDAGTDDRYQFCPPNEQLDKAMTAAGHKHLFRKVDGGAHAFNDESMKDNVACSLQFIAAAFAGKDAVAAMSANADKKEEKKDEPKKDGDQK